jgi:chromosome segregation ATPase
LIVLGDVLQDKVRNLELALSHLEAISAARIDEVITLTQKEIAAVKAEKEGIQGTLCAAQTDLAMCEQMKAQIAEYQGLEELCNSEVQKLQARVKSLTETQEVLQSSLDNSRAREAELQAALQSATATSSSTDAAAASGAAVGEGDSGNGATSSGSNREQLQLLLSVSQSRVADLQRELANSSANINDLIMEIETVSGEEAKARAQGARLQKQIAECQSMQRVALEENLHLQNHIEDLKMNHQDVETRYAGGYWFCIRCCYPVC